MAGLESALMDATVRFTILVLLFVLLAILEALLSARNGAGDSDGRLIANFGLGIGNTLLAAAIPIGGLAAAALAEARDWGLFQAWPAPFLVMLATLVLARSLVSYGIHRASHRVPWLWRIHRVHHSDRMVDLSTGLRNHPGELLIAMLAGAAITLAVGAPLPVAAAAELILFAPALWTHVNVRMPARAEAIIGSVLVTPALHLVHHSADRSECDSNYGDLLSIWDRAFGSYRPALPVYRIGLGAAEDKAADNLWRLLLRPLSR